MQVRTINDIPEDVLEYILILCTPYGDLQNCTRVSRLWHRVGNAAIERLRRVYNRCENFDWYLLQIAETAQFSGGLVAERCSHSACYHPNGQMYVFGGCTASYTTFNDLWRFDLNTRSWSRPMPGGTYPSPKACATLVEYNKQLILFGGWSKSSPNPIHQTAMFFNELHIYDPLTNNWQNLVSENAPCVAGHSVSVCADKMLLFGGSSGSHSCNDLWVLHIASRQWSQPLVTGARPAPRYGQSQMMLDEQHLVVAGGCGGPNMIFSDVWLLTIDWTGLTPWTWQEISVSNPDCCAPQLWSHQACAVGSKMVVLSKRSRSSGSLSLNNLAQRAASSGQATNATVDNDTDNNKRLLPPRRKLLTSRSLDEQEPPSSPKSTDRHRAPELQRASSIPAIIVGEIPKLVVTKDDNSGDSSASDGSGTETHAASRCIAMAASGLLPHQASQVQVEGSGTAEQGQAASRAAPRYYPHNKGNSRSQPSVRPNASADRGRQLDILRRMEDYMRHRTAHASNHSLPSSSNSSPSSPKVRFRPSSPPPKSKHRRPSDFLLSYNPMNAYVLELGAVLDRGCAEWRIVEGPMDAPEDTILYSLVAGRAELVMFGGMRLSNAAEQLHVTPFAHTITNETYILRAVLTL